MGLEIKYQSVKTYVMGKNSLRLYFIRVDEDDEIQKADDDRLIVT